MYSVTLRGYTLDLGFPQVVQVICGFILLSKMLTLFPNVFGKKKCDIFRGVIIGHRGSKEEGVPENTLLAFKDALIAGVDVIECDLWLSKDGEVVVHHDPTFERMTGGACKDNVVDLNYADFPEIVPAELQKERIEVASKRANGSSSSNSSSAGKSSSSKSKISSDDYKDSKKCKYNWHRVPTLAELMECVPEEKGLILEFKQDSDELIEKVHKVLRDSSALRRKNSCWFSLLTKINSKLGQKDPSVPRLSSLIEMLTTIVWWKLGLLPFMKLDLDVYGATMAEIGEKQFHSERALQVLPRFVKDFLYGFLRGKPPAMFYQPKLYQYLRNKGKAVFLMGVNNETDCMIAQRCGGTHILTDKPNEIVKCVTKLGLDYWPVQQD
jgi:glycerophosphoryl diester phosphodiesterase